MSDVRYDIPEFVFEKNTLTGQRMTKLFLKVNSQFDIPFLEQIKVFKKVGFDGFFTPWSSDVPLFANKAEEEGMIYSSIHAPYDLLAYMWMGGREAEECVS